MTLYHKIIASPVGQLKLVVSEKGLCAVLFQGGKGEPYASQPVKTHPVLDSAERQLAEYFKGTRKQFDLPLDLLGTPFQKKAWNALTKIPYGKTVSYAEQARSIGDPKKARPIGQANGKNPVSIIVPCHRVIGASGKLTGYGGGIRIKQILLELESRNSAPVQAKAA